MDTAESGRFHLHRLERETETTSERKRVRERERERERDERIFNLPWYPVPRGLTSTRDGDGGVPAGWYPIPRGLSHVVGPIPRGLSHVFGEGRRREGEYP